MIDFSTVKSIVIPEGEVSVIARGSEILWQKQTKKLLRYIKFVVNEVRTVGGTQMQFSEIEFLDDLGNRFNYPATTTVTSPNMPATATVEGQDKIIDGLTSTKFCTVKFASGRYLLIDLGEAVLDVNEFCNWRWWTANDNYGRDPISFELWGSEDGDTYKILDSAVKAEVTTARQAVAYMGKVEVPPDARLPAEYQEVAYLESTGTQWINTGIYPNDNTIKLEVKVAYNSTTTGQLMGSGTSGNERFNFGIESSRFRFGFGGSWFNANSAVLTADTEPHVWILDANTKTGSIDGVAETTTNTYSPAGARAIVLFARGTSAVAESGNRTKGKIYYAKIWNKGDLVRDLIPCYRKSDNEAGMYDLVTETFFTNAGTGEFLYSQN